MNDETINQVATENELPSLFFSNGHRRFDRFDSLHASLDRERRKRCFSRSKSSFLALSRARCEHQTITSKSILINERFLLFPLYLPAMKQLVYSLCTLNAKKRFMKDGIILIVQDISVFVLQFKNQRYLIHLIMIVSL